MQLESVTPGVAMLHRIYERVRLTWCFMVWKFLEN